MHAQDAIPLTNKEFEEAMAALAPFEERPHVAVAVSGGADSLALAFFLQQWLKKRQGKLTALIIDHQLRPESADEAETVKGWLDHAGINCEILLWQGTKPQSKIQEVARAHRYALLTTWCRAHDVWHLFVGHHQDDQWETLVQRLNHGSGTMGLQGIHQVRWGERVRLLRPFLGYPKSRLVAALEAVSHPYVNDPSNHNPRFERGQLRLLKPQLEALGFTNTCLNNLAREMRGVYQTLHHQFLQFMVCDLQLDSYGVVRFNREAFLNLPQSVQELVIKRIIALKTKPKYAPGTVLVEGIRNKLLHKKAATGGLCYWGHQSKDVIVMREDRHLPAEIELRSSPILWDNRFMLTIADALFGMTIRPFGRALAESHAAEFACHSRLLATLPALFEGEKFICLPHLNTLSGKINVELYAKDSLSDHNL